PHTSLPRPPFGGVRLKQCRPHRTRRTARRGLRREGGGGDRWDKRKNYLAWAARKTRGTNFIFTQCPPGPFPTNTSQSFSPVQVVGRNTLSSPSRFRLTCSKTNLAA